jgi:hypothetical protein
MFNPELQAFDGVKEIAQEIIKDNIAETTISVSEYSDEIVLCATLRIKKEAALTELKAVGE